MPKIGTVYSIEIKAGKTQLFRAQLSKEEFERWSDQGYYSSVKSPDELTNVKTLIGYVKELAEDLRV